MHRYNPRQRRRWECSSESEMDDPCSAGDPSSLLPSLPDGIGKKDKHYMVLHTTAPKAEGDYGNGLPVCLGNEDELQDKLSFTSILLNSIGDPDTILQKGSTFILGLLSSSQRVFWFLIAMMAFLFFYPTTSAIILGSVSMLLIGGYKNEDGKVVNRTAKWTITGFSQHLKDGFLASPPFLDRSGQWRMIIKQKKGMDGLQTSFGLMCTDIFPEVEKVNASVTFFCTNLLAQEVNTGGVNSLKFQNEYLRAGDCGFSRSVRISRRQLGESETITIHCTIDFRQKTESFFKTLARNLRNDLDGQRGSDGKSRMKRGKNVVSENGTVLPGELEFHEESSLPPQFRPVIRFVQHPETRTFVWEIPGFTTLLENSELWGIYSPQFFVHSHDVIAIWRMKLIEVQGVFRLHVQLRGLPTSVKQVKLWYILQLVDMYGDSVIPEHAISRVKYPDHLNLWDTTRHILYRRETILERFIGSDGSLCMRISLQMEPNDVHLMEVDSDEWIQNPNRNNNNQGMLEDPLDDGPRGILGDFAKSNAQMLTN